MELNIEFKMVGPPLSEGPLPAVFYFALSAEDSLNLDPYNQPVTTWLKNPVRIFSIDLPAHGPGEDKMEAMQVWAKGLEVYPDTYFESFFIRFSTLLSQLKAVLIEGRVGIAGLSRGGFLATHLAARFPIIKVVLGFAPATALVNLEGFPECAKKYDLVNIIPQLKNTKLKFYIGNYDRRVSTSSAYHFCEQLAQYKYDHQERVPQVEFSMFPSVGHKGHGTPPAIFAEGAEWMLKSIVY